MAILMNLTGTIICTLVLKPSAQRVAEIFATPFNGTPSLLATYFLGVFVLLIGYCFVLMIAKKQETKVSLDSISLILAEREC